MKTIHLPDGSTADFPDGMSNSEIEAVLAQHFGGPSAATQQPAAAEPGMLQQSIDALRGFRDIPQAGSQMLMHALPESVVSKGNELIGKANDLPVIGPITRAMGIVPETTQQYDQSIQNDERAYQQRRAQAGETGIDGTRLAGNIIATAPLQAIIPGAAPEMALGRATAAAAGQGAALGLLNPVTDGGENFAAEKGKQAVIGAATAGLLTPVARGVSSVLAPKTNDAVQSLLDAGVTPTPGQIMGGAANRIEEKLASLPLLGDAINAGRRRAVGELNTAALNRSLQPIGQELPKGVMGRDAIDLAGQKIGAAYDDVLNRIGAVIPDQQFSSEISSLSGLTQNLPKDVGDQFDRIVKNEILDRIDSNGVMTSEGLKAAEGNLGQIARGYLKSQDYDKRVLADAVFEAQRTLRSMLERQAPQQAGELKAINSAWANFMRPQRAAASVGAEDGVFTPAQLQNAVKALDPTRNKSGFARGNALMQDLSEPAKNVLGSKVPNSGTADRLLMTGGGLGLAGFLHPGAWMGLAGGAIPALAYTPAGQRAIAALLTQRPELLKEAGGLLARAAPAIASGSAVAAHGLLQAQ